MKVVAINGSPRKEGNTALALAAIADELAQFDIEMEIRFDDENLGEAIPAYIAIIAMPLFYSISEGISLGIISYVVLNVCTGKAKKVTPLMYILALLFVGIGCLIYKKCNHEFLYYV